MSQDYFENHQEEWEQEREYRRQEMLEDLREAVKDDREYQRRLADLDEAEMPMPKKTSHIDYRDVRVWNPDLTTPFCDIVAIAKRGDLVVDSEIDDAQASKVLESMLLHLRLPVCYCVSTDRKNGYRVVSRGDLLGGFALGIANDSFVFSDMRIMSDLNGKRWSELPRSDQRRVLETLVLFTAVTGTHEAIEYLSDLSDWR